MIDQTTPLEVVTALHNRQALTGLDESFQALFAGLQNDLDSHFTRTE